MTTYTKSELLHLAVDTLINLVTEEGPCQDDLNRARQTLAILRAAMSELVGLDFQTVDDKVWPLVETHQYKNLCDCGCNDPTFTTAEEAIKFLAHRLNFAGVSDIVAKKYARDLDMIISKMESDKNTTTL